MSIRNMVSDTIKRYAGRIKIINGSDAVSSVAFVEPLRYKNKILVGNERTPSGIDRTDKYLYIGLPENTLTENSTVIQTAERKYIVNRCELYYIDDSPAYMWALLKVCGDDLEDDYESD